MIGAGRAQDFTARVSPGTKRRFKTAHPLAEGPDRAPCSRVVLPEEYWPGLGGLVGYSGRQRA